MDFHDCPKLPSSHPPQVSYMRASPWLLAAHPDALGLGVPDREAPPLLAVRALDPEPLVVRVAAAVGPGTPVVSRLLFRLFERV